MIHVGGRYALEHYGATNQVPQRRVLTIFGAKGTRLPKWFANSSWDSEYQFHVSSLFNPSEEEGIDFVHDYSRTTVPFPCSSLERAILERFVDARDESSLEIPEKDLQMASSEIDFRNLQALLEKCRSIRVKRVFLYAASLWDYPWFSKLELSRINLGVGPRQFVRGGTLDKQFLITVEPRMSWQEMP